MAARARTKTKRTKKAAPKKLSFKKLESVLLRLPAMQPDIGTGHTAQHWWAKFALDIEHPLAWRVVQELGHILNYLSLDERLPTVFLPVSPPVYLNGGPKTYLSWVIENTAPELTPDLCAKWLVARLPSLTKLAEWELDENQPP